LIHFYKREKMRSFMSKLLLSLIPFCLAQNPDEVLEAAGVSVSPPLKKETTTTPKEEEVPLENMAGPTRFYFESGSLPKFLMEVEGEGIHLTVFKEGKEWDKFVLDKEASGGISGGKNKISTDNNLFQVDIDWKSQTFSGINNPSNTIKGLQLELIFDVKQNSFVLNEFRIVNLENRYEVDLNPKTGHGYAVMAPLGLSFGCYEPGMFKPQGNASEEGTTAGITLPGLQLQVYEVNRGRFGPIWECGNMIPIGLWCGLLVSLGFAMICAYGFSMLASINTMDRFDDPKKPSIYVPNTD
jgi:hypothetical protein